VAEELINVVNTYLDIVVALLMLISGSDKSLSFQDSKTATAFFISDAPPV
jgi:hypothetical protein